MTYLILLRHGESRWNLDNKFTGWVDVPLSSNGIKEAMVSSKRLENFHIDTAFTSKLIRAQETLQLILADQEYTGVFLHENTKRDKWSFHPKQLEANEIPIYSSDALNERYYGKLQGLNKDTARTKYGKDKVFKWRRSWDIAPPGGESLKETYKRAVPYFKKEIFPALKKGNVVVSAHGNSLRAIIKFIDKISDDEIPYLELPTGLPLVYEYNKGELIRDVKHTFDRPIAWKTAVKLRLTKNKAMKKR